MNESEIQQEAIMVTIIFGEFLANIHHLLAENELFDSSYFIEHKNPLKQSHSV